MANKIICFSSNNPVQIAIWIIKGTLTFSHIKEKSEMKYFIAILANF